MSPIGPININGDARFDVTPISSYLGTSPISQEILARDIADCSSEGEASDNEWDVDPDFEAAALNGQRAPLSFHPGGIAYGSCRPAVGPQSLEHAPPTQQDIEESRNAERSLLRDNHILPPKHPRARHETPLRRLYRWVFSTKVREVDSGVVGPALSRVSTKALETTPLLLSVAEVAAPTPHEEHDRWQAAVAANILRTTWQREAKTLLQYSGPLIITFLLHYSVTIGSVLTVGRIGMIELGAVSCKSPSPSPLTNLSCHASHPLNDSSVATMTANITCYAPLQGLATSLDTLCAQAYGSGHKHLVGLQAQRMTYLLWILLLPIWAVWLCAEPVLTRLVPDTDTAVLAAGYLRILVLGTPGVAAFESGKRFVQAQGLFHATTYVLAVGAPLSFLLNWFFAWRLGWGFPGAAMAMALTQNLLPLLLVLYIRFVEGSECWNGFSRRAFTNWGEYFFSPFFLVSCLVS